MRIVIDAGRAGIGGPTVSLDRRALRHIGGDETMQRRGGEVLDLSETNAPRAVSIDLNRAGEEHFALARAPTAARERLVLAPQGERRFVDLDNPRKRSTIRSGHSAAQLGGEQPRCFIGAERELLLQLQRGNSVGMRGHRIGRPKPDGQRQFGAVQDRPRRDGGLFAAGGAFVSEALAAVRPAFLGPTARTPETRRPACGEQPCGAGVFVGEAALKIDEQVGKLAMARPWDGNYVPVMFLRPAKASVTHYLVRPEPEGYLFLLNGGGRR